MSPRPAPPPDLAGRWLSKFFTDHLTGERAASPKTISSYRDAMKLLLTWFRDAERIPPEKLHLADIDRPRVLRFLDWLEAERNCSAATRNQRLAVIKSFCRYTAVEHPDHLDQVTSTRVRLSLTLALRTRLRRRPRRSTGISGVADEILPLDSQARPWQLEQDLQVAGTTGRSEIIRLVRTDRGASPGACSDAGWEASRSAGEGDGQVGDRDGEGEQGWCHLLAAVCCPPVGDDRAEEQKGQPGCGGEAEGMPP